MKLHVSQHWKCGVLFMESLCVTLAEATVSSFSAQKKKNKKIKRQNGAHIEENENQGLGWMGGKGVNSCATEKETVSFSIN